jgi:hypothetical protein
MSNTNNHFRFSGLAVLLCVVCLTVTAACHAAEFESRWPKRGGRTWVGVHYWANRLQDWRIHDGRLECLEASANKPMRTVHLLTHRLAERNGEVTLSVRTGLIDPINKTEGAAVNAAAGFLIGAGGPTMDYRAAALVHHNPGPGGGLFVGVGAYGGVVLHDFEEPLPMEPPHRPGTPLAPNQQTPIAKNLPADVTLRVTLKPVGGQYELVAETRDTKTGQWRDRLTVVKVASRKVVGNVALVSHPGGDQKSDRFWFRDWTGERKAFEKWSGATGRFWFRDWKVSGSKVEADDSRKLGPVISTQYTLHRGTLKLTAQLFPVGPQDGRNVQLQTRQGESWRTVAKAPVITPGFTATFRVEDWDDTRDTPYRVRYEFQDGSGKPAVHHFAGKIRRDPVHKETIVVAAFTGNMQVRGGYEYPLPYGIDVPFAPELSGKNITQSNTFDYTQRVYFPHTEVVRNVARQQPDLLFFSGDQVYEGNPTRAQEKPYEKACLDYLYKWYLWCWSFRELTREIPTVTIPDDHDVYQRNIWGDGGRASPEGDLDGSYGGYFMPPEWINMIQRTQTSHLPDPFDPRPAQRGVDVYYTALTTGGIGFAIIEDRKFKSFPTVVTARMSRDSHIAESAHYDTRQADVPGATLLGERQLKFLHEFSKDWRGQEMKAVLSQTTFANLQILGKRADDVPQEFDIPLDRDLDSNGWPQTGRRRALHEMRRGFMVHIAGDQHLASTIHHGTDEWEDACWSLCVPSIANYYARSWNPDFRPLDYKPGMPPFTGRYEDGFHNKLTVKAVANPVREPKPGQFPEPVDLHREAPGYGIVRFNKPKRTITMECWPRYADPTDPNTGSMYADWPITLNQTDNYARKAKAWLPTLNVRGTEDPVVQIIDETGGEVVYTLRIRGSRFRPKVFREGQYTIRVGQPDEDQFKTFRGVSATVDNREVMTVSF